MINLLILRHALSIGDAEKLQQRRYISNQSFSVVHMSHINVDNLDSQITVSKQTNKIDVAEEEYKIAIAN